MNAVKIRKWYENHCVMCKYYKEVNNYSTYSDVTSVCTAPYEIVNCEWILSIKRNKYAFTGWFDSMMEDCRFEERKIK